MKRPLDARATRRSIDSLAWEGFNHQHWSGSHEAGASECPGQHNKSTSNRSPTYRDESSLPIPPSVTGMVWRMKQRNHFADYGVL